MAVLWVPASSLAAQPGGDILLSINALSLLSPQPRRAVDRGIENKDLQYLSLMVLALIGLSVVQGVLGYFQGTVD